jgi:glutathione synthase
MEAMFLREIKRLKTPLILQKHLKEIQEGDKRIHFLNGKPICAFKRVPKEGHYLSNLAQGGYAKASDLTNRDIQMCERVGPILKKLGLVLVGVDVLGDFLLEINVTSPTGYRMAYELYGINIPKLFFEGD